MQFTVNIRVAALPEDAVAAHFYQMWRDNSVPIGAIPPTGNLRFSNTWMRARRSLGYQAFVAEVNNQVVGSVGCQRFAGLYPNILKASYRQDGYIWGVYVEPAFRSQGIATQLTDQAITYLRSVGCTHAVLNASPSGRPVYRRLGFADSNVMRRSLTSFAHSSSLNFTTLHPSIGSLYHPPCHRWHQSRFSWRRLLLFRGLGRQLKPDFCHDLGINLLQRFNQTVKMITGV